MRFAYVKAILAAGALSLALTALLYSPSQHVVFDATLDELTSIELESPSLKVTLVPGKSFWSARTSQIKDASQPPVVQEFRVSDKALATLNQTLAPLTAYRAWPLAQIDELAEYGLSREDGKKSILSLKTNAHTTTLELGVDGYGHRDTYAITHAPQPSMVLINGELTRLFTYAPASLMDKDLLTATPQEIKSISITYTHIKNQNLALTHHINTDAMMSYWSYTSRSPGRSLLASRFVSQLMNLKVKEAPAEAATWWEELPTTRELIIHSKGTSDEVVTLRQIPKAPSTYLARSSRTHHVVTLYEPLARQLFLTAQETLSGESSETPLAPPRHEFGDGHHH